jgi:hypothetical protein
MKIPLFLSLLFLPQILFPQKVENVVGKYDSRAGSIEIYYDLVGYSEKNEKYMVQAYYSLDDAKTFNQIYEATGDIGDAIEPGKEKKIKWDYFIENPDFTGENVIFKVEAKWNKSYEIKRLQSLGGGNKAFNSLLIPGWGHQLVSGKKDKWWTTALVYGLAAGGGYFALSAQNKYNQYKKAQDEKAAKDLLDQSNQQGKISLTLLAAGGTLWLSNVVWVALRGSKNKKVLKKLTALNTDPSPLQFQLDFKTGSGGLALKLKF